MSSRKTNRHGGSSNLRSGSASGNYRSEQAPAELSEAEVQRRLVALQANGVIVPNQTQAIEKVMRARSDGSDVATVGSIETPCRSGSVPVQYRFSNQVLAKAREIAKLVAQGMAEEEARRQVAAESKTVPGV